MPLDLARPPVLILLGILPALYFVVARQDSRRRADWVALGQSGRIPTTYARSWIAVMGLLVVALTGPRWGLAAGQGLPPGHDIVLLVDASRSMAAEDCVPNRLASVVAAATGFVGELGRSPGDRVGVVAFAGRAEPRCPLTENFGAAIETLRAIRPGETRPGGTDLGSGLLAALDLFDEQESVEGRTILVLTDGEDHVGSWKDVLGRLTQSRVVVHGVTVGDSERGHTVPTDRPAEPLRYQGETVMSRRSDAALSAICAATGGVLVPMGQARTDLASLYRDKIEPTARLRRETTRPPERIDRSSWFVAAAMGVIFAIFWGLSKRIPWLAVALFVGLGAGPSGRTITQWMASGEAAYRSGAFQEALTAFQAAIKLDPSSPIPRYNAGATLYQWHRFAEAEVQYKAARELADSALLAKIDYALGNVAVAEGRFRTALDHYDACLATKASGPRITAIKRDAQANRSFAAKRVPPPRTPDPEGSRRSPASARSKPSTKGSPPNEPTSESEKPASTGDPRSSPSQDQQGAPSPRNPSPSQGNVSETIGTPDQQLEAMMREVRKARASGAEPTPRTGSPTSDRKDW